MPDLKNNDIIRLQPTSSENKYAFRFTPASDSTAKGSIPYGTTISSVAVSGHTEDGTNVSNELIHGIPTLVSNTITVSLDYPSVTGAGRYHLTFYLTLDDGSVWERDFNRVEAEDL